MGEGTFGQVLECWDREQKEMVAINIVRGVKKYREAAMIEVDVVQQLGKHDKGGSGKSRPPTTRASGRHPCMITQKKFETLIITDDLGYVKELANNETRAKQKDVSIHGGT